MFAYLEARVVRPLAENQTLLILCAPTVVLVVTLPAGFLSERYGRRLLLFGGPAVTALGSLLSGLAPDFWWLLGFRFVSGAGSAMYMTGAMILLTDIPSAENRARLVV